jgi:hypothetical protein
LGKAVGGWAGKATDFIENARVPTWHLPPPQALFIDTCKTSPNDTHFGTWDNKIVNQPWPRFDVFSYFPGKYVPPNSTIKVRLELGNWESTELSRPFEVAVW